MEAKAKGGSCRVEQGRERGSLQQGFGLPGGVLGLEVLVGFHFVFYGQHLGLQLVPEVWQGVSNVIGELLNKTKQNLIHAHDRLKISS